MRAASLQATASTAPALLTTSAATSWVGTPATPACQMVPRLRLSSQPIHERSSCGCVCAASGVACGWLGSIASNNLMSARTRWAATFTGYGEWRASCRHPDVCCRSVRDLDKSDLWCDLPLPHLPSRAYAQRTGGSRSLAALAAAS
eukprot:349749-Chlamydomonas_euryale.AAC.5